MPITTNTITQGQLEEYNPSTHIGWTQTDNQIIANIDRHIALIDLVSTYSTKHTTNAVQMNLASKSCIWMSDDEDPENRNSVVNVSATTVPLHVLYAAVAVPKRYLEEDDGSFTAWLKHAAQTDAKHAINNAILFGNGINQPVGIVNAGLNILEQQENLLEVLLNMKAELDSSYDPVWIMSAHAFKQIIVLARENHALFISNLTYDTLGYRLFGHKVHIMSDMNVDAGHSRDDGAASASRTRAQSVDIIFGDFKAYTLYVNFELANKLEKIESYVEKVKYVYRMRVGGLVTDNEAFVGYKLPVTVAIGK